MKRLLLCLLLLSASKVFSQMRINIATGPQFIQTHDYLTIPYRTAFGLFVNNELPINKWSAIGFGLGYAQHWDTYRYNNSWFIPITINGVFSYQVKRFRPFVNTNLGLGLMGYWSYSTSKFGVSHHYRGG